MVLKLIASLSPNCGMFESSVNSDGTQTYEQGVEGVTEFESSVNSDGTQTFDKLIFDHFGFESSVNSDGTQTQALV